MEKNMVQLSLIFETAAQTITLIDVNCVSMGVTASLDNAQ